jgi:tRNA A37 threonylcarbamoyladenosine biosynthesis protein TsaE
LEDLYQSDNVLLIEWGEKFPRLLRDCDVRILIERVGENERVIHLVPQDASTRKPGIV